jgi:lon-related putative ATP-dependent protease
VPVPEVPVEQLRPHCDPNVFPFETTADVTPHVGLIGQARAIEAIKFGLGMESQGFNIVVTGEPGTGRSTAIREHLQSVAAGKPGPDEWVYVNNFTDPYKPLALRLPAGQGTVFARATSAMIDEARELIPRTFASDDYVRRRDEIAGLVQRQRQNLFVSLAEKARQAGFLLQGNFEGFFLVPLKDGEPMDDETFAALPAAERDALLTRRDALMEELRPMAKQGLSAEMEAASRMADLQRTVARNVVDTLVQRFFEDYDQYPAVIQHMLAVRNDMIQNIALFLPAPPVPGAPPQRDPALPFRRYLVNLLIDCTETETAPVVYESNPTPQHLFGSIEKEAVFGALTSDFTMIRPGSVHRANGGYLVFDFDDLLLYPLSWNELKRVLRAGEITIEELGDRIGVLETKSLRPQPIPWTGKVIAIARESVYRALYTLDPDFRELFKVKANFDMRIDRTTEHEEDYAGLISAVTKREDLPPVTRAGVARVVEEGMRLAEDHNKLSILFGEISDIIREAAYWARAEDTTLITDEHITKAIAERKHRVNLIEEKVRESITEQIVVVSTEGTELGQVNGLSVIDLGDTAFGQPSRITATVGVGREGVIDLQREAHMSGPIHSKAVSTLTGFLVDRYATEVPLTLSARLAFEQSYGALEGDSATVAETCALLSRLAGVPIKQSFAITGSMDQRGDVQAIGGANQKIEGFFDVCRERGLTGEQGVIIPASNIQHLMLREDVVDAVREGRFTVYSVSTVDEALELLTGVPAGERAADGTYPQDSINALVLAQLRQYAERLRAFSTEHTHEAGA